MAAISLPRDKPIRKRQNPGSIFRPASTPIPIRSPIRRRKVLCDCRNRRRFARWKRRPRVAYRAPFTAETIAAPGSQAIINWLPHLVPAKRVGILGFTYCEYAPRWAAAGAKVTMAHDVAELERQDVAIVVNPNNPDGRLVPAADLHALGTALAERGGLLIVDEAFVDFLEPGASAVPGMPEQGMIILRSFGKAYGLPGLRLGFAAGPKALAEKLRAAFGPWPVSGVGHRDRFKSLTRSCLARGRVDAPHGTGLGARQHTGCGRFCQWLAAMCSSGLRVTMTRKFGSIIWREMAYWCGVSQRIRSGCALVSRARILTSPGSLVHSKSSKPANSRNN